MSNGTDLDWLARNVHEWKLPFAIQSSTMLNVALHEYHANVLNPATGAACQITKEQWLARRAELQNKPAEWPYGANWLAQDRDGEWSFYTDSADNPPQNHGEDNWYSDDVAVMCRHTGEILGDWRDTLEKRPEQTIADICEGVTSENRHEEIFEPFVSVEDAAAAEHATITPSKYTKTIHGVYVDVYDVLQAWGVSNPALQHLIKKALQCGQRGHKDNAQDLQDIIDSAVRAKELG